MRAALAAALVTTAAASTAAASTATAGERLSGEHVRLAAAGPAVVEMRTAALIMSGQEGGTLPIAAGLLPGGDGGRIVVVEIDGATLLDAAGGGPVPVEVFAYLLGSELEVLTQRSLSVIVDPAAHREPLARTGLKVFLGVEVTGEERLLRVLTRTGEVFGLRGAELPAVTAGRRLERPAFHERPGGWLLAATPEIVLPPPFGFEEGAPLPAVQPPLSAGEPVSAQVFVSGPAAESWDLAALFRDRAGEVVETPVDVDHATRTRIPGFETAFVTITTPSLESGLWEMALALSPPAGARTEPARTGFVPIFIEGAPADDVDARAASATVVPELDPAERKLARAVEESYALALRQLAAGERQSALATLAMAETRVFEILKVKTPDVLEGAQSRLLTPLPDRDWGCVLPVVLLHLDLSRQHQAGGRFVLAHHARQMTLDLANAYAQKLGTPEAAADAAAAIASLAGHLQTGGALSQATRLYRHALSLADEPAAWLGLGSILEKRGQFREATEPFERFVEARPDHAEGRLRLALNRVRAGQAGEARIDLERLAAGAGDAWVQLLAWQELARLELDQGRPEAAAAVLGRGLERWPAHPTLTLQLAYTRDAGGDFRASTALLAGLDLADASYPATERSRYNRWPRDLLRQRRLTLEAAAESRLGELGRWLDGPATVDGG